MKALILFLATFAVGAALALVIRAARHQPYAEPASAAPASAPAADPHAGHTHQTQIINHKSDGEAVVNTVCPICGMDVDPGLKTATYQGKRIGFGCAACPSLFAREPDRYGPSALRNEVTP